MRFRFWSLLVTAILGASLAASVSPATAAAGITLDKSAPGSVLLGDHIPYELTAKNSGDEVLFNVSFSDVLPAGMIYEPGSVSPAIGEPVITTRGDGRKVLVWSNTTDLQVNASFTITFKAQWPDGASTPTDIAPSDTNDANVAAQTDPRVLPKFDANGTPIPVSGLSSASDSATTARAPFVIEKSEPSPENELLRGVHRNRTEYTLTVRNNSVRATENVLVRDYIPAGMEFLGCGDVDNTTPADRVEYPGPPPAPRLGVPALSPDPCPAPDYVDTVVDPTTITGIGSLDGVWTTIGWTVGDLVPGEIHAIKYVAGIPLQENTDTWSPGSKPPADSGQQGSNLDNNNGPSTRESIPEKTLTNHVAATGNFTGSPAGPYVNSTTESVQVEDIRMRKSVDTDTFVPGNIATFTLKIDASEYVSGSNIVVTDALPDGYCPLGSSNYSNGNPDCAPVSGQTPSTAYSSVTWDPGSKTYDIAFDPVSVTADGTATITFPARMLNTYRATNLPTVGGDNFVNNASLNGTTTPIAGTSESGDVSVLDSSKAEQGTALPRINKQLQPRAVPQDCSVLGEYANPEDIAAADKTFQKGDRVCFKLRVTFPDIGTRKPVVGDFLPPDTEYINGSAQVTGNSTAPVDSDDLSAGGPLVWRLGTGTAPELYVEAGKTLEVTFAVRVLKPAGGTSPEVTGNLMKMGSVNTAGEAQSFRDQADFDVAAPPNLTIKKGVQKTTAPVDTFSPPADNKTVQQGSTATFQIDIENNQRTGSDAKVVGPQAWDVLPAGITCAAPIGNFQYLSASGGAWQPLSQHVTCSDPPVNGQSTSSYIKWSFPNTASTFDIHTGETLSLRYDMMIPDPSSVSTNYANTAYVRSFDTETNDGGTNTYFPANNIDEAVTPEQEDSPEAKDPSNVRLRDVTPGKSGSTSVDETNNNLATEATIGETITYTYTATIPAGTTVFNAELSDALPSGIDLASIVGGKLDGGDLPGGFALDTNIATNPTGKLVFPAAYANKTNSDQLFAVTVTAKVSQSAITCAQDPCVVPPVPGTLVPKTNTAKFSSKRTLDGTAWPDRTKAYDIATVQPNPSVTKSASPTQLPTAQSEITYTVTLGNPGTRPPLHESQVVDCLPSPLKVTGITSPGSGVTYGQGAGGCSGDGVVWDVGTLVPDGSPELIYTAKADGPLAAGGLYTNTATLTGTSMPGTVTGERTYTTNGKATVTAPKLVVGKKSTPGTVAVGQTYTSVITTVLRSEVDYYSAAIIDTLPTGVSPSSVTPVSVTCTYLLSGDDCDPLLGSTFLTPAGQKIGWSFGNVVADNKERVVAITYTARVADVAGNTSGVSLTNAAQPHWSSAPVDPIPTTIARFEALPNSLTPVDDTVEIIEPRLSIEKKVDTQDQITAAPGDVFTYSVKVSNWDDEYASTAYNVKIVDTLPAGITVVGNASDGGVLSGNTITWTLDSLAKNTDKAFSYQARLAPPGTTAQTNTVAIDEYFSLPVDPNNPDIRDYNGPDADAVVNPVLPELTIKKTATSGPLAYIDEPYTWTMEVSNDSQATAFNFGVKDTIPTNWEYVADSAMITIAGATPTQINPAVSGLDLTWAALGDLAKGQKASVQYQAKPKPAVVDDPRVGLGIDHVNTTTTDWTDGPAGQGWATDFSDKATAATQIASADLELKKTHQTDYPDEWNVGMDEVVPGTEFDWNINVTNNGVDNSMGPFVVKDTLPAGTEYKSYAGTDWSCGAVDLEVTCTHPGPVNGLVKDESLPILTLTVKVDAGVTGDLKNVATVAGKTYDPIPGNNTDEDPVTARLLADLAIEKTRTQPYVVGDQVTYTLAVTNLGPSVSVKDITVVDTLPQGLSIASIDAGAWQCQPTRGETDTLTCVLKENLDPLEQAPLINVIVDVLESPGAEVVNTAEVTGTTEDPNLSNNKDSVTDPVVSEVQLGLAKRTTGANPVTAGTSTEFTITVSNFGPAKAKNVKVVDELEAGLRATSAAGPGWSCDVGTATTVTCTRANFPVSASPSNIVIKADVDKSVPGGTTLKNVATVTTASPQPGGNPDPAPSTVDVVAKSDLAVFKTHTGGPWTIGRTGTWNVRVVNNGPSDNPGPITVVDHLPRGNEFLSAAGDGWSCGASGRTVTCVYAAGLLVGQESAFSIRVNVVKGAAPSVINPAEVTSPITDTDPSNNKAEDVVRVRRERQSADKLPPNPSVLPARKTDQGRKIKTKVRCRTIKRSTAGQVSYCKVTRKKNGTVKVKVVGKRKVKVIVTQYAKGTKNYKPFVRVKKYIVRP